MGMGAPYLNGPMQKYEAPFAWAAAQKAVKLAPGHSTPVEADLIEAMSHRYVENFDPDKRKDQDTAYAEAMRKLHEKYPQGSGHCHIYRHSTPIRSSSWSRAAARATSIHRM